MGKATVCELSVLQNLARSDIRYDPYPHIVIDNCLPPEIYAALAADYPDDQTLLKLNGADTHAPRQNMRYNPTAHQTLAQAGSVSPLWEQFVRHHTSQAFLREFLALMGPEVRAAYPWLEARLGSPMEDWTAGMRYGDGNRAHIALDCQIGINTPTVRTSSVRRVHTDAGDELYAMLFYFRRDDDRSTGGDLEIHRWKAGCPHLFVGTEVDQGDAERVRVVPYRANTLVIFINAETSLHAVSARTPSPVSRRLINIIGRLPHSVPEGLFVKQQKQGLGPLAQRLALNVRRRFGG
jgi:hypothetical protein